MDVKRIIGANIVVVVVVGLTSLTHFDTPSCYRKWVPVVQDSRKGHEWVIRKFGDDAVLNALLEFFCG